MLRQISSFSAISLFLLGSLPARVFADQILQTSSFTTCGSDDSITVQSMDIKYNADTKLVTFDVAGTSAKVQNVSVWNILFISGRSANQYRLR
jgi:hypothetical protein